MIPTSEIEADIRETEAEASQFEAELGILRNNPIDNRLKIYMAEGHLSQRREFIEKLRGILAERGKS